MFGFRPPQVTGVRRSQVASFLFGVSPRDPIAFIGATMSLALVGIVASYLPARRTGNIDPIETLRVE